MSKRYYIITMHSGLKLIPALLLFLCAVSCKQKEKDPEEKFFPVLSFIKSQVAHVDTSLYTIRKIISIDSLTNDTIYLRREDFREAARDFLSLPDLYEKAYFKKYEEARQYDETLNRVIIDYTPLKPEKEIIQRQEVLIKPDVATGDKITNIIIHSISNTRDSLIQKRLLWQADKSFQVVITRQLPGQPETTSTYRVVWNEDEHP